MEVSHSNIDDVEQATAVLKAVEINIEGHSYRSNLIIDNYSMSFCSDG